MTKCFIVILYKRQTSKKVMTEEKGETKDFTVPEKKRRGRPKGSYKKPGLGRLEVQGGGEKRKFLRLTICLAL